MPSRTWITILAGGRWYSATLRWWRYWFFRRLRYARTLRTRWCSAPQEAVEVLALLMKLFYMDRHTGILLFWWSPTVLVPSTMVAVYFRVDTPGGRVCCLLDWPQLQQAPRSSPECLLVMLCHSCRELLFSSRPGLSEQSLMTHRACAALIDAGVAELEKRRICVSFLVFRLIFWGPR